MKEIPEERYVCKWCFHCGLFDENSPKEKAICNVDIGDLVDVTSPACGDFDYDDTFKRY